MSIHIHVYLSLCVPHTLMLEGQQSPLGLSHITLGHFHLPLRDEDPYDLEVAGEANGEPGK